MLAENLLSEMQSAVSSMNKTLECPQSMMLSDDLRNTGEWVLAELKKIQLSCRCAIADPKKDYDLIGLKELNVKLGHAKKIESLMTGICNGAN